MPQVVTLKSGPIHYNEMGRGKPLVLLHPSSGTRTTRAMMALAERFRLIQPIAPGFDGTPAPASEAGVAELAGWIGELIDSVADARVAVAGHSFGGWVGAWLSVQRPERVASLVLQAPLGFGTLTAARPGASSGELLARTYARPERRVLETRSDDVLAQNRAMAARYGRAVTLDADLIRRLPSIAVPTLIIHGSEDGIVQRSGLEWLVDMLPSSRLEVVADAAHHIESDQPETYAALVSDFITTAHREREAA